jgi:hypothetical protein
MTVGGKIFIPQAYVLEQYYADAISRPAAAPASATIPAAFNPSGNTTQPPQR